MKIFSYTSYLSKRNLNNAAALPLELRLALKRKWPAHSAYGAQIGVGRAG